MLSFLSFSNASSVCFFNCHCSWNSPLGLPPLTPPRERVWSALTIDRYIVPDRLDRATNQQKKMTEGGGERGFLGNVCFSVSNLVQLEELCTALHLKHTIHDGLTHMLTHTAPTQLLFLLASFSADTHSQTISKHKWAHSALYFSSFNPSHLMHLCIFLILFIPFQMQCWTD